MTDSEKLDLILSKINNFESDMQEIKRRTTNIELHLENVTDKNLAYEVKVNYLVEKVQTLEKEIAELKGKIA